MRYLIFAIIFSLSLLCVSCASEEVKIVQNSKLGMCPQKTVKQMVDGFLNNPKWSSGMAAGDNKVLKGSTLIDIKGEMRYADKPAKVIIQFVMSADKQSFELNAVEINGEPQERLVGAVLFRKMCD